MSNDQSATTYRASIPKFLLVILNNLYEIERKMIIRGDTQGITRNIEKIKDALADQQLYYEDPFGQSFDETRTDLDASISGVQTENLVVVEVIKPIIRFGAPELSTVIQKGIVIVQSKQ